MAIQYQTGLASLFTAIARVERRYVYHYDVPNNRWNVFEVVDGRENYLRFFVELEDARDFCSINNGVIASLGGE